MNNIKDRQNNFGGTKRAEHTCNIQGSKLNINIKVIIVNTGNLGVRWSGLFENRLQKKGFHNFHFLLMKTRYFQISFFRFCLIFHSCSEEFGINKVFL